MIKPFASFRCFGAALAAILSLTATVPAQAAGDSAVVFMYHRFGEGGIPSTNIRIEQFEAHLAEIATGKYTVLALPDVVAALRENKPLPDRAIALTIDDAFLSVYTEAWPRLKAAGIPFTLFVATDPVDQGLRGYMNWDQIRDLVRSGVTVGHHTASHLHMPSASRERNAADIAKASRRYREELGFTPDILAYPYGEYGEAVRKSAVEAGFIAAFGQHSGVAYSGHDLHSLPRFALNETYGTIGRFRLAANALPLRVADVAPQDNALGPNPPAFGFTVEAGIARLGQLACYASHLSQATAIERLGQRRFEVRLEAPFPSGRGRINCTMPADGGRWRWYGVQFYVP
jgi:peptidoglycan/xylan/chitin deacetylase (PgdA/CDA1 family)